MQKKWHPLTFTDACSTFTETKQEMWAQWSDECILEVVMTQKISPIPDGHTDFFMFLFFYFFIIILKTHHAWWWLCWKTVFCSWEFALSDCVIVLFVSVVVFMETNRKHYFQSNLYKIQDKTSTKWLKTWNRSTDWIPWSLLGWKLWKELMLRQVTSSSFAHKRTKSPTLTMSYKGNKLNKDQVNQLP